MKFALLSILAALILIFSGCSNSKEGELNKKLSSIQFEEEENSAVEKTKEVNKDNNLKQSMSMKYNEEQIVVMKTSLGDIKIKLFTPDAPKTVNNFLKLAETNFYNGTKFHRVIKDFMIQSGDPLTKEIDKSKYGTGGPGYTFEDEFNSHKLVRGSLAMANSGPNTNGSQFFIVTASEAAWLDGKHTNFGEVIEGLDVVDKIETAEVDGRDCPLENIEIKNIERIEAE